VGYGKGASAQSWWELLVDLKTRGLADPPELAIGDGALGFEGAGEAVADNLASALHRAQA
jgi:transposase-like protein